MRYEMVEIPVTIELVVIDREVCFFFIRKEVTGVFVNFTSPWVISVGPACSDADLIGVANQRCDLRFGHSLFE